MKISDAISNIKNYHHGYDSTGKKINDEQTRDQILYGNAEQKCTGIITTIFASIDVIRQAHELGANLLLCMKPYFGTMEIIKGGWKKQKIILIE